MFSVSKHEHLKYSSTVVLNFALSPWDLVSQVKGFRDLIHLTCKMFLIYMK